jgi:hypothetical protein
MGSLIGSFGASPERIDNTESRQKVDPCRKSGKEELGIADQLGKDRVTTRRILV